ncbi:hypothetical protein VTN77DRAFT_2153 [Rasamsonia byssochlamydoides]|uniref:uncharacterized protein n=1 Tax=Rasamsonia byssochlamydoides TaxID=89139 RepID=UPI0037424DDD
MASKKPLQVGVLVADSVQLLDMACVDLLNMATPEYLTAAGLPSPMVELGRPCDFYYISTSGSGTLQESTANIAIRITHSIEDEVVAPGKLDVLIIPGPDPRNTPSEEVQKFVREHNEAKTTIFAICTGVLLSGHCGILKGKHVTGPRALIPSLRKKFPEAAKWDDTTRVVHDGNLWTSGGVTNGNDLIATYLKETYPGPVAQTVCAMAEVGDRPLKYKTGPTRSFLFFVWQFLKAFPASWFQRK